MFDRSERTCVHTRAHAQHRMEDRERSGRCWQTRLTQQRGCFVLSVNKKLVLASWSATAAVFGFCLVLSITAQSDCSSAKSEWVVNASLNHHRNPRHHKSADDTNKQAKILVEKCVHRYPHQRVEIISFSICCRLVFFSPHLSLDADARPPATIASSVANLATSCDTFP